MFYFYWGVSSFGEIAPSPITVYHSIGLPIERPMNDTTPCTNNHPPPYYYLFHNAQDNTSVPSVSELSLGCPICILARTPKPERNHSARCPRCFRSRVWRITPSNLQLFSGLRSGRKQDISVIGLGGQIKGYQRMNSVLWFVVVYRIVPL